MFIVGLTGGIGSGKSVVSSILEEKGITVVDADVVAREVVEPGTEALKQIEEHFGSGILQANGSLNRAELRKQVFTAPEERKWLEQLLHPIIRDETVRQLKLSCTAYTILSSPLLLETDQHLLTEYIVVVDVPEKVQLERTIQRDNNSEEQVRAIIAAQINREERLNKADSVISNSGSLDDLKRSTDQLHEKLLLLATSKHEL